MGCPNNDCGKKKSGNITSNCVKAKQFLINYITFQNTFYIKHKRFGSFNELGLGSVPNPDQYSYNLLRLTPYAAVLEAIPIDEKGKKLIAIVYTYKPGNLKDPLIRSLYGVDSGKFKYNLNDGHQLKLLSTSGLTTLC